MQNYFIAIIDQSDAPKVKGALSFKICFDDQIEETQYDYTPDYMMAIKTKDANLSVTLTNHSIKLKGNTSLDKRHIIDIKTQTGNQS